MALWWMVVNLCESYDELQPLNPQPFNTLTPQPSTFNSLNPQPSQPSTLNPQPFNH